MVALVAISIAWPQIVAAIPGPLSAPDLKTASDTGISSSDNLTQDTYAHFVGSCTTGDTIKLYANSTMIAQGTCTSNNYELSPSSAIADGTYNMTVTATDGSGESTHSDALSITIDTNYPLAPSRPDLDASSDTGRSSSDNDTRDKTPTFTGTCTPGNRVTIRHDSDNTTGPCSTSGTYSITISVPSDSDTDVIAWQTDDAGNDGVETTALNPTFDFTPPAIPSKPDLVATSDSGRSNVDNITNDTTPTFSGTCEYEYPTTPYYTVTIRIDGEEAGQGTCSTTTSTYAITASTQATGTYDVDAVISDQAGNTSDATDPLINIKIDTSASAPSVDGSGGSIAAPNFSASGSSEANSIITIDEGSTNLALCFASGSGSWSCNVPTPSTGSHSITFKTLDIAGNISSATTRSYTVN
ncbi:MAG TPA: Ig-like domain-containing protein [Patescibacteria group bacterium]|nr:Ig-like domain-containing protein [Patescibacteria group bacterium]